ncbi:MAG TPA: hypothetical protein VK631_04505, partial [Solirubrobacteraceae bacterium]|nr:hypothetical protein [Solirubrobacteraceae bacterium]
MQVIDERNRIAHVTDIEGQPGRRPLTREELMAFFDFCDAQGHQRRALGRKGAVAAFRRRGVVQDDLRVQAPPPGGRAARYRGLRRWCSLPSCLPSSSRDARPSG